MYASTADLRPNSSIAAGSPRWSPGRSAFRHRSQFSVSDSLSDLVERAGNRLRRLGCTFARAAGWHPNRSTPTQSMRGLGAFAERSQRSQSYCCQSVWPIPLRGCSAL
jgi:hypothetical protein